METSQDDKNAAVNPKLLVEVPSEGTEQYDRGEKLTHYREIPSLDAIVLVSHTERRVEIWERSDGDWVRAEARGGGSVSARSLGCTLSVDSLYDAAGGP